MGATMSALGIQRVGKVFAEMHRAREELLRMGCEDPRSASGQQDIKLSHLMDRANEAIADEYARISLERM